MGTEAQRKRTPRQAPGPERRKGIPRRRDQRRPTPSRRRTTSGGGRPQHTTPKHESDGVRITPAHTQQPPEATQGMEGTPTEGERATRTEEAAVNTAAQPTTTYPSSTPSPHEPRRASHSPLRRTRPQPPAPATAAPAPPCAATPATAACPRPPSPLQDLELGPPPPPPGPRPPRLVVCPRLAGTPPLGDVGRGSGKARRGANGAHLRGGPHPHPCQPLRGHPGGHHAAGGMGGSPPRRGPGPPPPLHPPSPPPMAPGHPPPGLGHRRPPPKSTTTTPGGERARARVGQGTERDTQARGHGRAPSEGQAPIGTGHLKQHNVGAENHPTARKGQEWGPRRRERGHHGKHQDPNAGRAYHDGGTSAAPPPADAAQPPGADAPNTRRRSTNRTAYGSHQHTPSSHQKPHRGWRAHLQRENGLHAQRKPL